MFASLSCSCHCPRPIVLAILPRQSRSIWEPIGLETNTFSSSHRYPSIHLLSHIYLSILTPTGNPPLRDIMSTRLSPAIARLPSIRPAPFRSSSQLSPFLSLNYSKQTSYLRTMSSSTAAKKEFLCIIPDHPGTISKRMEVRP